MEPAAHESASSASDSPDEAALGVLLVHGIGEQAQGVTLMQGAGPIVEWMRDWLSDQAPVDSLVASAPVSAALRPPLLDGSAPAHARVVIGTRPVHPDGTDVRGEEWLFAEAWWAPQVLPPSLRSFTAWLLICAPWLALFHLNQQWLHGTSRTARRVVVGALITIPWMVLSLVVDGALILLYLLSLIPIDRVRRLFAGILRTLSGVLGDAYVKLRHPIQRRAQEDAVLQAMRWLRPRCSRLAVVAHSQGAAIAHDAMLRDDAPPADLLVTVGSGMVKLWALRYFERLATTDRVAALLAPPVLLLAMIVAARGWQLELEGWPAIWAPAGLGILGLSLLASAWRSVRAALADLRGLEPTRLLDGDRPARAWVDIVASHDPVPQGLATRFFTLPASRVQAREVAVLRSALQDHIGYWTARASFLPVLVEQLAAALPHTAIRIDTTGERFLRAARRFQVDLRVLRVSHWLDGIALALPLLLAPSRVVSAVESVRQRTAAGPLAFMDRPLASVDEALRWLIEPASSAAAASARPAVNWCLAAVVLLTAFVFWRRAIFSTWQLWSGDRNREVLRAPRASTATAPGAASGSERIMAGVGQAILHTLLGLFGALPILLSVSWTFAPLTDVSIFTLAAYVPVALFALLFVAALAGSALDRSARAR